MEKLIVPPPEIVATVVAILGNYFHGLTPEVFLARLTAEPKSSNNRKFTYDEARLGPLGGMSYSTLLREIKVGKIKPVRISSRIRRIEESEIKRYLSQSVELNFVCQFCGRKFSQKGSLVLHERKCPSRTKEGIK